jgi:hypothetical protein
MTVSWHGEEDAEAVYHLGNTELQRVTSEKDIGVCVDSKLKFDDHINASVQKATRIMAAIRRTYTYLDEVSLRHLFRGLVRPHLEYAQSVWQPYLKRHITQLERVQRRATKLVPTLRDLPYPERLRRLLLPTLAYRRLRGDMIETFKILHGIYDQRATAGLLSLSVNARTRGHPFKLKTQPSHRNQRLYSFTCSHTELSHHGTVCQQPQSPHPQ